MYKGVAVDDSFRCVASISVPQQQLSSCYSRHAHCTTLPYLCTAVSCEQLPGTPTVPHCPTVPVHIAQQFQASRWQTAEGEQLSDTPSAPLYPTCSQQLQVSSCQRGTHFTTQSYLSRADAVEQPLYTPLAHMHLYYAMSNRFRWAPARNVSDLSLSFFKEWCT